MTGQVTFINQFRQPERTGERLVDRARRRRQALLGTRTVWVIETAQAGMPVTEHRFDDPPRIADLVALAGADASLVAVRTEEVTGRRRDDAAGAAV